MAGPEDQRAISDMAPQWVKSTLYSITYLLEHGVLFQVVGMVVMVIVVGAYLGFFPNPQMEELIKALENISTQHHLQAERGELGHALLKQNEGHILKHAGEQVRSSQRIANKLTTLCVIQAANEREKDLCRADGVPPVP